MDINSSANNDLDLSLVSVPSTVSVPELQKQLDAYSKELRETDELIQGLNWTTELK